MDRGRGSGGFGEHHPHVPGGGRLTTQGPAWVFEGSRPRGDGGDRRGVPRSSPFPPPPPRPPPLEPDVPYDFLASGPEEELLLHSVCEPNGADHLRPHPAVRCGQRVNEVFRVGPLWIPFVRSEVGTVLETGFRDDSALLHVLIHLEPKVEVELDLPGREEETRQRDLTIGVRVANLDRASLQEMRRLDEGELEAAPDDLSVEAVQVECAALCLVEDHRA